MGTIWDEIQATFGNDTGAIGLVVAGNEDAEVEVDDTPPWEDEVVASVEEVSEVETMNTGHIAEGLQEPVVEVSGGEEGLSTEINVQPVSVAPEKFSEFLPDAITEVVKKKRGRRSKAEIEAETLRLECLKLSNYLEGFDPEDPLNTFPSFDSLDALYTGVQACDEACVKVSIDIFVALRDYLVKTNTPRTKYVGWFRAVVDKFRHSNLFEAIPITLTVVDSIVTGYWDIFDD